MKSLLGFVLLFCVQQSFSSMDLKDIHAKHWEIAQSMNSAEQGFLTNILESIMQTHVNRASCSWQCTLDNKKEENRLIINELACRCQDSYTKVQQLCAIMIMDMCAQNDEWNKGTHMISVLLNKLNPNAEICQKYDKYMSEE